MLKVFNEKGDDLSPEFLLQLSAMMMMLYASEVSGYEIARWLDAAGNKGSFVQKQKQAIKRARISMQSILRDISVAFDDKFDKIGYNATRCQTMHEASLDVLHLILLFISRDDLGEERKNNIKKAVANFKEDPRFGKIDEVLTLYKIKKLK